MENSGPKILFEIRLLSDRSGLRTPECPFDTLNLSVKSTFEGSSQIRKWVMPSVIDRNHIGVNDTLSLGISNLGYVPCFRLELDHFLNYTEFQTHFISKISGENLRDLKIDPLWEFTKIFGPLPNEILRSEITVNNKSNTSHNAIFPWLVFCFIFFLMMNSCKNHEADPSFTWAGSKWF